VAVNPYRNIPIYEDETVRWYRGQKRQDRPPHIYSVADGAYQALMTSRQSQSILITGESGAGKTENTKRVIHYLTAISTKKNSAVEAESTSLEHQLILTNPILEAFGNAQTVRNNNSSRFGKFIRIDIDSSGGHIVGASIEKYLLEKSRVTHRSTAERNFHIFYQLLQGASNELLVELKLMDSATSKRPTAKDFAYTNNSNSVVEGVDDLADFKTLEESFAIVGITNEESKDFFRVLAIILLLGNLKLTQDEAGQAHLPESEDLLVGKICELLGVDETSFRSGLLNPVIRAGKEVVTQAREMEQVQRSIEALSRSLYERLFGRLVDRLNTLLFSSKSGGSQASSRLNSTFIGVLDIAGFEIFERNSFEQLLINYTNEKLQQFFNHHMFIVEQEEYAREGITWDFVDFGLDSQPMIDLLEKSSPVGILPCLDEDCVLPRATDKSFTSKVQQLSLAQNTGKFDVSRINSDRGFTLHHYAGRVEYSTEGWVEKNKDPLNENVTRLLANDSKHTSLRELFSEYGAMTTVSSTTHVRSGIFRTVAQKHRESLNQLMAQLGHTQPHFVRCILPNSEKQPGKLVDLQVLEQLQCNGVLEGIRICRQGYPNRLSYADFWRLYSLLGRGKGGRGCAGVSEFLSGLLGWQGEEDFALGAEKVFFRAGRLGRLDGMRDARLAESLRQLQAVCRGALCRARQDCQARQALSVKLLQGALRPYLNVRRDLWSRLIGRVRPLLSVTRSENKIREMQAQVAAKERERAEQTSRLQEALENAQKNLVDAEEQRLGLKGSLEEKESLLAQLMQKLEDSQTELGASQTRNQELDRLVQEMQRQRDELAGQIAELTDSCRASEAQVVQLQTQLHEQEALTEGVQNECLQQQDTLQAFEAQKVQLLRQLEESKSCQEQLQKEVQRLVDVDTQTHKQMQIEREKFEAKIVEMRGQFGKELEVLASEIESERKRGLSLKETVESFEREKEGNEAQIRELQCAEEEAKKREVALLEVVKGKEDQLGQLKMRAEELEGLKESSESQVKNLTASLNAMTAELKALQLQVNETQGERQILTDQLAESQNALRDQNEQLTTLQTIRAVLESELETSRTLCVRLSAERETLQSELLARPVELLAQLEKDATRRQELLQENRRLERELKSFQVCETI
jgi:myosin heavy chain 9/10/11/14